MGRKSLVPTPGNLVRLGAGPSLPSTDDSVHSTDVLRACTGLTSDMLRGPSCSDFFIQNPRPVKVFIPQYSAPSLAY